jgi:hypothetical protein
MNARLQLRLERVPAGIEEEVERASERLSIPISYASDTAYVPSRTYWEVPLEQETLDVGPAVVDVWSTPANVAVPFRVFELPRNLATADSLVEICAHYKPSNVRVYENERTAPLLFVELLGKQGDA